MYDRGAGWVVLPNDTPVMDLGYANGFHDGNAYFGVVADYYSIISGSTQMVREQFRYSGTDRTVTSATVRVKRISGSSPLTVRLESSSGSVLGTGTTGGVADPHLDDPGARQQQQLGRGVPGRRPLGHRDLPGPGRVSAGATYNLRMSTASDTTYVAVPIREEDATTPVWGARAFRDGSAQETTDGGTWHQVYDWAPLDEQFYLR